MPGNDLLIDSFGRIREIVHDVLDGLTQDDLDFRAGGSANSIGWLIWHLTRIQDDHIAGAGGLEQVWLAQGWAERCGLPLDPADTGYGHSSDQVAAVRLSRDLLADYHDATYEQTLSFVSSLTDADMNTIVDRRWDPPVTMGVRLVSVLADDLQHAGQAAYVKGLPRY
ncbi:MAG TPA: DinB family protein [Streptosporangiaceae bacterium]|nr:DinB family protein [Streptosporangiaceae bacterium]